MERAWQTRKSLSKWNTPKNFRFNTVHTITHLWRFLRCNWHRISELLFIYLINMKYNAVLITRRHIPWHVGVWSIANWTILMEMKLNMNGKMCCRVFYVKWVQFWWNKVGNEFGVQWSKQMCVLHVQTCNQWRGGQEWIDNTMNWKMITNQQNLKWFRHCAWSVYWKISMK